MKYVAYLTGMFGALGVGALALIPGAAGILTVITSFLTPVASGLGELLKWILEKLFDGVKNSLDTLSGIAFVLVLVLGTQVYTNYYGPKRVACEQEIGKLVAQIKQLKKLKGVR